MEKKTIYLFISNQHNLNNPLNARIKGLSILTQLKGATVHRYILISSKKPPRGFWKGYRKGSYVFSNECRLSFTFSNFGDDFHEDKLPLLENYIIASLVWASAVRDNNPLPIINFFLILRISIDPTVWCPVIWLQRSLRHRRVKWVRPRD